MALNMNTFDVRPLIPQKVAYPLTENDSRLEKHISKEFECPVCFNYIIPPIMMCINSHVICFDCWRRCISCPTCRVKKSITRAWALERIHSFIAFPCKWEGCPYIASGPDRMLHVNVCRFYPTTCPLGNSYECSWKGIIGSLPEHLIQRHQKNVFLKSGITLRAASFTSSEKQEYTMVFIVNVYDLSFREDLQILLELQPTYLNKSQIRNDVHWKLKVMKSRVKRSEFEPFDAPQHSAESFSFEIEFEELVSFCQGNHLDYQVIIEASTFEHTSCNVI
ncbi:E3 ubiquitin-protein ligase Siah1-like isoform X2 [Euwallacea similis]|uniref:E3 ubiquitin-protein ligase Siah1-like isoform X2 n=1 Tax=Euwallacea similis TaxID=1736056 RepID=UPI00344BC266